MSDVVLQHVTHRYEQETVLDDIDLTIPHGSFFTLLGPSGCGKTTLLRILAGFIAPSEGRVFIDGVDVTDQPCEKRNMGVVFQNYALFPNMTVRENIAYGLKVRGMRKTELQKRCERYIELTGLEKFVDRHVQDLSGGQQQRVAVARALAIEPQMLLLDEPMSNLDVALRIKMREEIRSIQRETGVTTLFITHDQQEALSISDYIAVMREGSVLQVGTPEEIYNHPANAFIANFVGTTNAFKENAATLSDNNLTSEGTNNAKEGSDVLSCIRPEQLSLAPSGQDGLAVRIVRTRFVGPYYEYEVCCDNTGEHYSVLEVNRGNGSAYSVGDTCTLVHA